MITFLAAIMILTAIGIVSWPLLKGVRTQRGPALLEDSEVSELLTQKDATLFAINELESDYEIGSLSQGDYQELRNKYEEKAVALIKTVDELRSERGLQEISSFDEEIEVKVSNLRVARSMTEADIETRVSKLRRANNEAPNGTSCPACGARVESDAQFCYRCGITLSMKCPGCSARVSAEDIFCSRCGKALNLREARGS